MSQAVILIREIVICPECFKKGKIRRVELTPKGIKDLNIHLLMKHGSDYKIVLAENSASFMPRSN